MIKPSGNGMCIRTAETHRDREEMVEGEEERDKKVQEESPYTPGGWAGFGLVGVWGGSGCMGPVEGRYIRESWVCSRLTLDTVVARGGMKITL